MPKKKLPCHTLVKDGTGLCNRSLSELKRALYQWGDVEIGALKDTSRKTLCHMIYGRVRKNRRPNLRAFITDDSVKPLSVPHLKRRGVASSKNGAGRKRKSSVASKNGYVPPTVGMLRKIAQNRTIKEIEYWDEERDPEKFVITLNDKTQLKIRFCDMRTLKRDKNRNK
jgi:hypothetical protein